MGNGKARVIIDETLFQRIANNDSEAFEVLYKLTYKPIFALLLSLTQNYHDAQDLLQETYIKIQQGAHLYTPQGNPMAWMMKISRNIFLTKYRSDKREVKIDHDADISNIPYENIEIVENRMILERLFKELDSQERAIIVLHLQEGFKYREIAEILDKPLGTVLTKYNRALKKLNKVAM